MSDLNQQLKEALLALVPPEDLKKAKSSNQSFWQMGQPEVEVHGFDDFDTDKGELVSGRQEQDRRLVARYRLRRTQPFPAPGLLRNAT